PPAARAATHQRSQNLRFIDLPASIANRDRHARAPKRERFRTRRADAVPFVNRAKTAKPPDVPVQPDALREKTRGTTPNVYGRQRFEDLQSTELIFDVHAHHTRPACQVQAERVLR